MVKEFPEFLTYFLSDCLEGDDRFTTKRLFGGHAVFFDNKVFSLYLGGTLYFKVGKDNINDYLNLGAKQFTYKKQGKIILVSYYELPEEVLEDREKLLEWIDKSLAVK